MVCFVVFTGLPGTGKSSVAEEVGRRLKIPVFAKDWLEATLKRGQLQPKTSQSPNLGYVAYELLTVLAERQLQVEQSVILDSVASIENVRRHWRRLAKKYNAKWIIVECICSDEEVHRQRLLGRQRGIEGWHELSWAEVERVKSYYANWDEERLIIDAMNPFEENYHQVVSYIKDSKVES